MMNEEATDCFTSHLLGAGNFDLFLVFLMYGLSFFPQMLLEFVLFLPQLGAVSITYLKYASCMDSYARDGFKELGITSKLG